VSDHTSSMQYCRPTISRGSSNSDLQLSARWQVGLCWDNVFPHDLRIGLLAVLHHSTKRSAQRESNSMCHDCNDLVLALRHSPTKPAHELVCTAHGPPLIAGLLVAQSTASPSIRSGKVVVSGPGCHSRCECSTLSDGPR
jgi:hypothetical protein